MGKDLVIHDNMYGGVEDRGNVSPILIESCFFEENGAVFPPHWHEQLLLIYIEKGEMAVQCGNERVLGEEGTIVIVNPNVIHSGENRNSELAYYLFKIDLILLLGNQPDLQQTMYTELLLKNRLLFENKVADDEYILSCLKTMMIEHSSKKEGYELIIRGLTYQVLTALIRAHTQQADHSKIDMQYRRLNQIKPSIQYMEEHISEKITLADLSESAHLSSIHFSRVFKAVSGFSPMDFLNQIRVQKAAQLLLKTDKPIVEIAMDTGFNDGNYFSRIFKNVRKETPSEFRNKYVKG